MEYYIFSYQLSSDVRYLIWVSNDEDSKNDRFVTDAQGIIPAFTSLEALQAYAAEKNLPLPTPSSTDPINFDSIVEWLSTNSDLPACDDLLNAWNAFSDMHSSIQRKSAFSEVNFTNKVIYDKIFWGNNLPAVTPEGEHYDPSWSADELETMKSIYTSGIDLFISSTYIHE
jgi:hypothetical protein